LNPAVTVHSEQHVVDAARIMGVIFGLTAVTERLRRRRLKRLGQ
jgi:hypothetical protein